MVGDDVSLKSVKQAAFDGFAYHGISTYNICEGLEGWFSQIRNDQNKEVANSFKLIPGQNCMKLRG